MSVVEKTIKSPNLLVIDDDKINSMILIGYFKKKGWNVHYLSSGKGCLSFIKENNIDLVLLDLVMPDLSGYDVLKIIRQEFKEMELPVIMVTASHNDQEVVESFQLGANDYITKPINIAIAIVRVETQLGLANYYRESLKAHQFKSINAIITTYNHEINNPLTIAMARLSRLEGSPKDIDLVNNALQRIAEITKKIRNITPKDIKLEKYSEGVPMLHLKKDPTE